MKKKYIKPTTRVIVIAEPICLVNATVYKEKVSGNIVDKFEVVDKSVTVSSSLYAPLWGQSNKDNWGDD